MKLKYSWITFGLAVSLMSGCGGDSNNNPAPQSPSQPGQTPATLTISIVPNAASLGANAYQPNPAAVQPGMSITWVNNDSMTHTVTSDAARFDSGNLSPGQSFTWVVPTDITNTTQIDYHCMIHPSMTGTLTLSAAQPSATPLPSPSATPLPSPSASTLPVTSITQEIPSGAMSLGTSAFGTPELSIAMGTTVTYINRDSINHTVTADDGSYDSGSLAPGESWSHTFTTAGTYHHHCSIHPSMRQTIVAH